MTIPKDKREELRAQLLDIAGKLSQAISDQSDKTSDQVRCITDNLDEIFDFVEACQEVELSILRALNRAYDTILSDTTVQRGLAKTKKLGDALDGLGFDQRLLRTVLIEQSKAMTRPLILEGTKMGRQTNLELHEFESLVGECIALVAVQSQTPCPCSKCRAERGEGTEDAGSGNDTRQDVSE